VKNATESSVKDSTLSPAKGITPKPVPINIESAWNASLKLAGLTLYYPPEQKGSATSVELLERCYQAHGTMLTAKEAIVFARANNIPYNRATQKLNWTESVAQWKKERQSRNQDVPAEPPPRDKRPNYREDVQAARPGERRQANWANIEDILPHVITYLEQLPAGALATRDDYARWAKQQRAAATGTLTSASTAATGKTSHPPPSKDAIQKHGGWAQVSALAHERIRQRQGNQTEASQTGKASNQASQTREARTGAAAAMPTRAAAQPTPTPRAPTPAPSAQNARTRAKAGENATPAELEPAAILKHLSFQLRQSSGPKGRRAKRRIPDVH
jgi:hypothetical protein